MSAEELDALPAGTLLYVPVGDGVSTWEFAGRVPNRLWYTLVYPPDKDGVINNRRPVYVSAVDLLQATTNEGQAWQSLAAELADRQAWIQQKLNSTPTQP
jgi:hypothetical protein